tara:strand:- start:249 stop:512 length:264 start_codon:yes stop_codon:yes gene_type:complete
MGICLECTNSCITHHSKELYIENQEKYFQRTFTGYKDTVELKAKRRKKFEQEFLESLEKHRKWMGKKKISDKDIIENYKSFTSEIPD